MFNVDIVIQLGFACIEISSVSRKNVTNILLTNILCLCKYLIYINL